MCMNTVLIRHELLQEGPIDALLVYGSDFVNFLNTSNKESLYLDFINYYIKLSSKKFKFNTNELRDNIDEHLSEIYGYQKILEMDIGFSRDEIDELKKSYFEDTSLKDDFIKALERNIVSQTKGLESIIKDFEVDNNLLLVKKDLKVDSLKRLINRIFIYFNLSEDTDRLLEEISILKSDLKLYKGDIGFYYKDDNQNIDQNIFYGFNIIEEIVNQYKLPDFKK